MEQRELEAQMLVDFEEEIDETIVPLIKKLLSYAFVYGYQLGRQDTDSKLEENIENE